MAVNEFDAPEGYRAVVGDSDDELSQCDRCCFVDSTCPDGARCGWEEREDGENVFFVKLKIAWIKGLPRGAQAL